MKCVFVCPTLSDVLGSTAFKPVKSDINGNVEVVMDTFRPSQTQYIYGTLFVYKCLSLLYFVCFKLYVLTMYTPPLI